MHPVATDEGEKGRQESAALRTRAMSDHAEELMDFQEQEAHAEHGGHRHRAIVHAARRALAPMMATPQAKLDSRRKAVSNATMSR